MTLSAWSNKQSKKKHIAAMLSRSERVLYLAWMIAAQGHPERIKGHAPFQHESKGSWG